LGLREALTDIESTPSDIGISDVNGLTDALANKLETSLLKTTLAGNLDTDIPSVKAVNTAISGIATDLTLTPVTTLELDLATVRNYKAALAGDELYSEVNFDLTNIPTNILCTFLIVVTGNPATEGRIINIPNTANDKKTDSALALTAGDGQWVTLLYDGTTRYWEVHEYMS
jgi:hypothetical protein